MKMFKNSVLFSIVFGLSVFFLLSAEVNATPIITGDLEYETFSLDHTGSSAGDNSFFEIVLENAGYANNTTFGIYEVGNSSNQLTVFDGIESTGSKSKLQWDIVTNDVFITKYDSGALSWSSLLSVGNINDESFGFFIDVGDIGQTWYSETSLNVDGIDHLATMFGGADNAFNLRWEDLYGGGDTDYNDLVVYVDDVIPNVGTTTTSVPEPMSLGLMGLGLLGMLGFKRNF